MLTKAGRTDAAEPEPGSLDEGPRARLPYKWCPVDHRYRLYGSTAEAVLVRWEASKIDV